MGEKTLFLDHQNLGQIAINEFLLEIIRLLGKTGSFDLDLVDILIDYINFEILILNEKFLAFQKNKIKSKMAIENIKKDNIFELTHFFNGQEEEIKQKEDLLILIDQLGALRYELNENFERNKKFKERIEILSIILERNIDDSSQEIEKKLNNIYYRELEKVCPLFYRFIENKLSNS